MPDLTPTGEAADAKLRALLTELKGQARQQDDRPATYYSLAIDAGISHGSVEHYLKNNAVKLAIRL